MQILSTLGFAVPTPNGTIPATTLPLLPKVLDGGTVENLPEPEDGVWWLVHAFVMAAAKARDDLVMFNPALTVRDANGLVTAQGGCIRRNGQTVEF